MKCECIKCKNNFEDVNYELFGEPKRYFCNNCVDCLWKERGEI